MPIAIKAENLSKAYQLGEIGTGTISRDLERWISRVRGKEDPFLRIGETNDRTTKGNSDVVWSLKDINFEIEQGDAVGIIGRNGAGKSTLLKILSRVTSPTTGRITGKGRIASLLEVGTGFHPELTGRENIYLNGAILGMRKREITRKFDEIVDFAGVERYIDTPVKRYSSGMYVRLAFAVAAHLESEILIVDEVLAVGDAEFQKKCLGKMGEVSKGEGRTVLFVSHNMAAVKELCNKGIIINSGKLEIEDSITKSINRYLLTNVVDSKIAWYNVENQFIDKLFSVKSVYLIDYKLPEQNNGIFNSKSLLHLCIEGNVLELDEKLKIGYEFLNEKDNILYSSLITDDYASNWPKLKLGLNKIRTEIPLQLLESGKYSIRLHISVHNQRWICNPNQNKIVLRFEYIKTTSKSPYQSPLRDMMYLVRKYEVY